MKNLSEQNYTSKNRGAGFQRSGVMAGMMCLAVLAGMAISPPAGVRAEVRAPAAPENVHSGSLQSVPILQDIAATLRQIDGRLARLEAMAVKASGSVD